MTTHSRTLAWKSHGRRSLVGCSPWCREESDTTEWLLFYFSLSCIGEENGNPLQCSCLEYPRDRWAWWASIYGVAQSRTRLKQLNSSSSSPSRLYIVTLIIELICKLHHVKCWTGWITSWDQDFQVKYQHLRYADDTTLNARKQRETKEILDVPWVYTCSQSWTPLLSPSPYHTSGSSQCTSPKLPVSWMEPGLARQNQYNIVK